MGWKFWAGVTLMIVGMAVMALPNNKPCVDCDDEVTEHVEPHIEATGDGLTGTIDNG